MEALKPGDKCLYCKESNGDKIVVELISVIYPHALIQFDSGTQLCTSLSALTNTELTIKL